MHPIILKQLKWNVQEFVQIIRDCGVGDIYIYICINNVF